MLGGGGGGGGCLYVTGTVHIVMLYASVLSVHALTHLKSAHC